MGLQLIFVVETNKSCKSDWIYRKDTIDYFYKYENTQVKFTTVYMGGKGNYKKKEKEITGYISQYASVSKENQSKVIYCFDCDDYDAKPEDFRFLEDAEKCCSSKGYEFVWFCRDIEQVYLGKRIEDKQKKSESAKYKAKKEIKNIDKNSLSTDILQQGTSNIMKVLAKYLQQT